MRLIEWLALQMGLSAAAHLQLTWMQAVVSRRVLEICVMSPDMCQLSPSPRVTVSILIGKAMQTTNAFRDNQVG